MGCGQRLRRQTACTNILVNLQRKRPAFHTPSVAFSDMAGSQPGHRLFPASRRGSHAATSALGPMIEASKPEHRIDHVCSAPVAGEKKGRARRIAIVAMARKLAVALWRRLETGVVPEEAVLKRA
jgi:hypothetical protein